jgi:hypothetical protein
MTWAVDMALLALLGLAWAWRGGSDALIYVLAGGFAISAFFAPFLHGMDRHVLLWLIDAAIVAGMGALWTVKVDMRAYTVGLIGLGKIGWRLAYSSGLDVSHWTFAAAINAGFAMQVIVAGGMLDVAGHWLDDWLRVLLPRRYRLLRNVEGA